MHFHTGLRGAPSQLQAEHSPVPGASSPYPDPSPAPLYQNTLQRRTPSLLTSPPFLLSSALRPFSAAVPICSDALVGKDVSVPKQGMVPRWAVKSSEGNRGWRFQSNKSKSRTSPPSKVAFLSPDMGENAGKPEVRFSAPLPREKHSETHPQPEDRGSLVVCTATSRSGALPPRQRCHSDTSVGIRTQNKARTARCPALTLSPRLGLQRAQHWDSPESRSHDCRLMLIPLHTAHS